MSIVNWRFLLLSGIFFIIVIYALILRYIYKLENIKCECSANWKRDFIKYYVSFILTIQTLLFLGILFFTNKIAALGNYLRNLAGGQSTGSGLLWLLTVFLIVLGISFTILSAFYLYELQDCQCSELFERYIFQFVIFVAILNHLIKLFK